MSGDLLTVSEVGRITGVTRKALRHYESVGLVRPVSRTPAGYRLYDAESVRRLHLVHRAKDLGLSLAEAEEFIHVAEGCCGEEHPELVAIVTSKLGETRRRIAELQALGETLQGVIDRLEANEGQHRCEETLCTCNQLLSIGRKGASG